MSRYFGLGSDGHMYDLCDCGDIEAAEESATDVMPEGIVALWLADAETAKEWSNRIIDGLLRGRIENSLLAKGDFLNGWPEDGEPKEKL